MEQEKEEGEAGGAVSRLPLQGREGQVRSGWVSDKGLAGKTDDVVPTS